MATAQKELQSQVVELSEEAFEAFCDDIAGMFGVEMQCTQQSVGPGTIRELRRGFKKPAAVNSVKAEGTLEGTFHLIFDREGLFTLAGVIVMLPEQRILENCKSGSESTAAEMADAIKEGGNLLVGSWDRVFREQLEGHGHFLQSGTLIGNPWVKSEEKIGLDSTAEFVFAHYKMTIDPYPAFNCGVIFPTLLFGGQVGETLSEDRQETKAQSQSEPAAQTEAAAEPPTVQKEAGSAQSSTEESAPPAAQSQDEQPIEQQAADRQAGSAQTPPHQQDEQVPAPETGQSASSQPAEEAPSAESDTTQDDGTPAETQEPDHSEAADEKPQTEAAPSDKPSAESVDRQLSEQTGPVSQAIREMVQPDGGGGGNRCDGLLSLSAGEMMSREVVWASPEDTVRQVLAKMQQAGVGYVMVGQEKQLDGIISRSNMMGAISPYLQQLFSRWRRPLDDATLEIKIKWIMSRPVQTINPGTSATAIMENMCRLGQRAFPVMNEQGKVEGLVTVFDIFRALLRKNTDVTLVGKTCQVPPLL